MDYYNVKTSRWEYDRQQSNTLPPEGDVRLRAALADAERRHAPQQEHVTGADIIRAKIAIANADLALIELRQSL